MAQTKKIEKCVFSNEWKGPNGSLFFHALTLEGDNLPWNIASITKEPDFLQPGKLLTFNVKDESKRTIQRVQPENKAPQGGNDYGVGAMVGNAITNATALAAAGKINLNEIGEWAEIICDISMTLKSKY
jgi:hypothetical protein